MEKFCPENLVTTQPNNPKYVGAKVLRINVGFVMAEAIGFTRELEINVPSLLKLTDDLFLNHFYATLQLSNTREGVLIQGTAETSVTDECSRCTDEVWIPIEFGIEELFARHTVPEMTYYVDDSGDVDLAPLVREESVLHTPMVTPVDKNDRCVFCQRTFQDVMRDNGLVDDDIDPRLSVLLKLRQQMEETDD